MSQPAKPTRVKRKAVLAAGGRVAQIGRHRQDRAGSGADAVDRRQNRLRTQPHRLDQIAGHAGKGEQLRHPHFGQRADDLEHVAARTEIAAGAGQHDGFDALFVDQAAEGVAQLGIGVEGQRVLLVRPVQRDGRDPVGELPVEMLGLKILHHITSPPAMMSD